MDQYEDSVRPGQPPEVFVVTIRQAAPVVLEEVVLGNLQLLQRPIQMRLFFHAPGTRNEEQIAHRPVTSTAWAVLLLRAFHHGEPCPRTHQLSSGGAE